MTRNTTREAETGPGERVQAVQSHDLPASVADLVVDSSGPADRVVETINDSDVEDIFLHRWQENYAEVKEAATGIRSVDLGRYLDGMERMMQYHVASRDWKWLSVAASRHGRASPVGDGRRSRHRRTDHDPGDRRIKA